jgi:rhamnogalacturonyl hydrolase YesR
LSNDRQRTAEHRNRCEFLKSGAIPAALPRALDAADTPKNKPRPPAMLEALLRNLRSYVPQRGFWYTVIDDKEITATWIKDSLDGLRF